MEFISSIFEKLDTLVKSFMQPIFEGTEEFLLNFFSKGGQGGYIVMLLMLIFLSIVFLIGLFKFIRKFRLFLFIALFTVGISILWYFIVLK